MKIDCYLSEFCGSYYELLENLGRALDDLGLKAEVAYHTVYYDEAVAKGITGSPSIWVDEKDLFETYASPGIT